LGFRLDGLVHGAALKADGARFQQLRNKGKALRVARHDYGQQVWDGYAA